MVGPGGHIVEAVVNNTPFSRVAVEVKRKNPEFFVTKTFSNIYYPSGGEATILFRVNPPSSRVESVQVMGDAKPERIEIDNDNKKVVLHFKEAPANNKIDLKLVFNVKNPDNTKDAFTREISLPVKLSDDLVNKWDKEIDELIDKLHKEETSLASWITQAKKKLRDCKATVEPLGYDCVGLEAALDEAKQEISKFDNSINRLVSEIEKEPRLELIQELLMYAEQCGEKGRYAGLVQCSRIKEIILKLLEKTSKKVEKLYEEQKYDEAMALGQAALNLCKIKIPGKGIYCGKIESILSKINDIQRFLEEMIFLYVPTYTTTKKIKAKLIVNHTGTTDIDGVSIDLSPSKGYLKESKWLKKPITLPKLPPGVNFAMDLELESLVEGRIPVMFRVCYKKYCIEQRRFTTVGRIMLAAPEEIAEVDVSNFVGKPVPELRQYPLEPLVPKRLEPPITVGKYQCTGVLASGGFAATLFCSSSDGEKAVVKVPREILPSLMSGFGTLGEMGEEKRQYDEELKLFDAEARVLQLLDHPNIIRVITYGVTPFPYLVFEYCDYGDLYRLLNSSPEPLDPKTALKVMIPVADALRYGHEHEKQVIHLDVKPSNILIDKNLRPRISDYNISMIMSTVSRSSRRKGIGFTPGFSAPEQVNTSYPPPSMYSDIFAHAATLYYMLAKHYAYPREMWIHDKFRSEVEYTPVRKHNPNVPEELDAVLASALKINPVERGYQLMREYIADLVKIYNKYYK